VATLAGVVLQCAKAPANPSAFAIQPAQSGFTKALVKILVNESGGYVPPNEAVVVTLTDAKDIRETASFFPGMGTDGDFTRAPKWEAQLEIAFQTLDGKTTWVTAGDDPMVWSQGQGDRPARGDLKAFVAKLRDKAAAGGEGPAISRLIERPLAWNQRIDVGLMLTRRGQLAAEVTSVRFEERHGAVTAVLGMRVHRAARAYVVQLQVRDKSGKILWSPTPALSTGKDTPLPDQRELSTAACAAADLAGATTFHLQLAEHARSVLLAPPASRLGRSDFPVAVSCQPEIRRVEKAQHLLLPCVFRNTGERPVSLNWNKPGVRVWPASLIVSTQGQEPGREQIVLQPDQEKRRTADLVLGTDIPYLDEGPWRIELNLRAEGMGHQSVPVPGPLLVVGRPAGPSVRQIAAVAAQFAAREFPGERAIDPSQWEIVWWSNSRWGVHIARGNGTATIEVDRRTLEPQHWVDHLAAFGVSRLFLCLVSRICG